MDWKGKNIRWIEKETDIGWSLNLESGDGLKKVESLIKMLNWKKEGIS